MPHLVLAIDIGNSAVTFGLGPKSSTNWIDLWKLPTSTLNTAEDWTFRIQPHIPPDVRRDITDVICASVVPTATESFLAGTRATVDIEPHIVSHRSPMDIRVTTDFPEKTGTDRIVNANMVWVTRGGPSIVVDAGTATKIDAVTATGEFPGGIIAPGIGTMMKGLALNAAQLSEAPIEMPSQAIGRNTVTAMQSGVVLGHARMIEGLILDVISELGEPRDIVMTGGFSSLLAPRIPSVRAVEPNLILDGLRLLTR